MKIKLLLIDFVILLSFLSNLKAQNSDFVGGLLLNFNGIQIEGEKEQYWDSTNGSIGGAGGTSVGAFVKREFNKNWYGVFELRFIQKGSIYEFANQFGNRALELLRLNYMEIPVLVGYEISTNKKPIYFEAGLAYSRMFKSDLKFQKLIERFKTPNVENYKNSDISLIADLKFLLN
ncbi:MAG: outer membrane beta-barrel protein [Mariniphaga sp.]|nr:outer membrane beta-barrel protein [Mariniphaga sp.]